MIRVSGLVIEWNEIQGEGLVRVDMGVGGFPCP